MGRTLPGGRNGTGNTHRALCGQMWCPPALLPRPGASVTHSAEVEVSRLPTVQCVAQAHWAMWASLE